MRVTIIQARECSQGVSEAKKAAGEGPVFITDQGHAKHVLLTIEDFELPRIKPERYHLDTSLELEPSGPGRLHEQFVSVEAVTPGQYENGGAGLEINYGFHPSPFDTMLLACTGRGICALLFADDNDRELAALSERWPQARLREDVSGTEASAKAIFDTQRSVDKKFYLAVLGTDFQVAAWRALLKIPTGRMISYEQLAGYMGKPKATQATSQPGPCRQSRRIPHSLSPRSAQKRYLGRLQLRCQEEKTVTGLGFSTRCPTSS